MCCRLCCVWMEVLEQGELPKKRLQNCRPYNNSKLCILYKVLSRIPLPLYKKSWSCRDTGHPSRKSGRPAKIGTGGNPSLKMICGIKNEFCVCCGAVKKIDGWQKWIPPPQKCNWWVVSNHCRTDATAWNSAVSVNNGTHSSIHDTNKTE